MMGAELGTSQKQVIYSIEECEKCGLKNKRLFMQGDYVIKKMGQCPRCSSQLIISAIYAEAPIKG
jgi:predicted Zn-ribbon and HTH transcriptional regulator